MLTEIIPPINQKHQTFCLYNYLKYSTHYKLKDFTQEIIIQKNEYLYKPPFEHNYIYEVLDGAIKLGSYTDQGDEYVHDVVSQKDFFGNLKYLNNQFFEFSKTITSTRLRVYNRSFFKQIIINEPTIAEWFISYLVKRWCASEKKMRKVNERNSVEKLRFLRTYFNKEISDIEGNDHILYDLLTQKDLGDLVGATRQTIASALKKSSVITG
ncbi:MAG: Crp/Fnr family transcriptional regulator [Bacteroidota bacterium]